MVALCTTLAAAFLATGPTTLLAVVLTVGLGAASITTDLTFAALVGTTGVIITALAARRSTLLAAVLLTALPLTTTAHTTLGAALVALVAIALGTALCAFALRTAAVALTLRTTVLGAAGDRALLATGRIAGVALGATLGVALVLVITLCHCRCVEG